VVGVVSESDLALKEVAPLREAHTPVFETAQHRLKVFLRSDEELRFEVLDHVIGDLRLPSGAVEVEVSDGVVRLAGRVPRRSQALAMEKLTGAVDGVVAVESELHWQVDETAAHVPPAEPAPLG
jgi:hypothetical protein